MSSRSVVSYPWQSDADKGRGVQTFSHWAGIQAELSWGLRDEVRAGGGLWTLYRLLQHPQREGKTLGQGDYVTARTTYTDAEDVELDGVAELRYILVSEHRECKSGKRGRTFKNAVLRLAGTNALMLVPICWESVGDKETLRKCAKPTEKLLPSVDLMTELKTITDMLNMLTSPEAICNKMYNTIGMAVPRMPVGGKPALREMAPVVAFLQGALPH